MLGFHIVFCECGSQEHQCQQKNSDLPLNNHLLQLVQEDTEGFPKQPCLPGGLLHTLTTPQRGGAQEASWPHALTASAGSFDVGE